MAGLCLAPIYIEPRSHLVTELARRLSQSFLMPVQVCGPWFDPEQVYDTARGQYHSTRMLQQLLTNPPTTADRILGITTVDLFIPVLTYVFGEAQLGGRAAVVSLHRLDNQAYGLPPDPHLLLARLEKEALHELGHTFGLVHCRHPSCVMEASTYAEDIDRKPAGFCLDCLRRLRRQHA